MIAKEVNPVKKLFLLVVTLVTVLSLCLPAGAEPAAEVTKYGNIGRLSKLNITEDQLNDVLKDIMVNSICNRYVFYDTMTDMPPCGISHPGTTASWTVRRTSIRTTCSSACSCGKKTRNCVTGCPRPLP